jgi:hypothetical protein
MKTSTIKPNVPARKTHVSEDQRQTTNRTRKHAQLHVEPGTNMNAPKFANNSPVDMSTSMMGQEVSTKRIAFTILSTYTGSEVTL